MYRKLLIANRGEVALRVARAASELGIATVAVYAPEDGESLHLRRCEEAVALPGQGAAAYLDASALVAAALAAGCEAVHPGYGFLSENAGFARACAEAGLAFVGPSPETLALFGDKVAARRLAEAAGVPLAAGSAGALSLSEAEAFMAELGGPVMVKALAGGGGRGMRLVERPEELAEAYRRAASEAEAAFGSGDLYLEELIRPARHVEVQILGDAAGAVTHLWERECSLQRRHQKLVELAPAPGLPAELRASLAAAAVRLGAAAGVRTLCTVEFLLQAETGRFVFMEANPRLQVEHPVTEEVTGVDLVQTQLRLAAGESLADLGLAGPPAPPRGLAVEVRVNMERVGADGGAQPSGGTLTAFEPPGGAGVRVESFGYAGYRTTAAFDSLLAKVIATAPSGRLTDALGRCYRALSEFRIEGVETNLAFLQGLLLHSEVVAGAFDTGLVSRHAEVLVAEAERHPRLHPAVSGGPAAASAEAVAGPPGTETVPAPMSGRLVSLEVEEGAAVAPGQTLAILEAMKMEHQVPSPLAGIVRLIQAAPGEPVVADRPLLFIEPGAVDAAAAERQSDRGPDHIRADLAEVLERQRILTDAHRQNAVARRRKTGQRTARENIDDLCDPGSFVEYGGLALAAQRRRRSLEELVEMSPADGLVAGIGTVNGDRFPREKARCLAMSYDYTVFAGTQGFMNHKKMDRMLHQAAEWSLPVVVFAEGGGGRPGETDFMGVAGLDVPTFLLLARHSGRAPSVAIVSGRCFAGNAAVAGCCDLIIATENANLGMGGPAMIEGGGLGVFRPEEVGPVGVQTANGVIDLLVPDEAAAVAAAKQYLAYFQGPLEDWDCADQRLLRQVVPENRLRAYDIRQAVELLADSGSVLELRPAYGVGIVTALVRIEGRPMGLIANNPGHLGGAIDAEAAEKAARFLELCEAYGLPILSLCDTPGFMVGPEAEGTALVRRVARMFLSGANVSVPFLTVVLRKGYGLGAQSMAGGSFQRPLIIVSWPSGEFGGMGLEGAVRLGYRNELAAIEDPGERKATYDRLVAELYERGKAVNMASFLEIDGVIDPAETRSCIVRALAAAPPTPAAGKRRPFLTPR